MVMLSVERLRRITVCRVDLASRLVVTATSSSLDLAALTSLHATRAGSVTVSRTTSRTMICRHSTVLDVPQSLPVKALKSSHATRILRSLHCLRIAERIEYNLLSGSHSLAKSPQPPNLRICTTSSLFSLLAALALHLSSLSLDHQHHPRYV